MKALSVIELSKLYGMNRQSIYKRINKGDLSKNSDGKIDLSEAIRVFGEPGQRSSANVAQVQSTTVQNSAEVDILSRQVDMLQKQLEQAQEREQFQREQLKAKDEQIYSLQLLLGAPKPQEHPESIVESVDDVRKDPDLASKAMESKNGHQAIKETRRRSLFDRVIRAVLN